MLCNGDVNETSLENVSIGEGASSGATKFFLLTRREIFIPERPSSLMGILLGLLMAKLMPPPRSLHLKSMIFSKDSFSMVIEPRQPSPPSGLPYNGVWRDNST